MDDSKPWDGHPTQEDLDIERAEQGFADPGSANMQFLQSTLPNSDTDSTLSTYSMQGWASPGKASHSVASSSPGFSNLAPAYSGLGLIGAVGSADFAGGGSALGLSSAVAAAAPAAMGKTSVGDSAALAAMGAKAMAPALPAERFTDGLPLMKAGKEALVPLSPEFEQLMAMLGVPSDFDAMDPAQLLISGGGTGAENLQSAIDAVMDQITLLNNTFEPLMEGLSGEVQSQVAMVGNQSTTDLGLNILTDAQSVSSTLGDVLGTVNVGANPQFAGLLNLGSAIDEVLAVVDTLPTLDPVTTPIADIVGGVLNPITEPVTDIVGGIINNPVTSPVTDPITEPVTDIVGGIINNPVTSPVTDPITEPVTDIVGGIINNPVTSPITDPVTEPGTDIVGGIINNPVTSPVTDPVTEPVTDIVGGIINNPVTSPVTDPITEPVTDVVGGVVDAVPGLGLLSGLSTSGVDQAEEGLLDGLSSGISSSAGSEGGALDGVLGGLDPNKG